MLRIEIVNINKSNPWELFLEIIDILIGIAQKSFDL